MFLIHSASFLIKFTIVFVITSIIITVRSFFEYLSKMFDLPFEIIVSLIEMKKQNENKSEEV